VKSEAALKEKRAAITIKGQQIITETDWQGIIALTLTIGYVLCKLSHIDVSDIGVFVGLVCGWYFRDRLQRLIR